MEKGSGVAAQHPPVTSSTSYAPREPVGSSSGSSGSTGSSRLRTSIGLGQGVALYVSAILGAGVLVLPGQAASLAGPASLLAWGFSALLGIPLALTFAALATRTPGAGGVAAFAAAAFGAEAGGVVGWWYFVAGSVGQTIVPLTGGYYVAAALGLSPGWSFPVALVILAAAVVANLAGVRVSARVQVALAAAVALVLLAAAACAVPQIQLDRLHPFATHGVGGVGRAVAVLFFAFAGWEAVAHLSGEFRDVRRDLPRATGITIVVVSVLTLAIAAAVVLTGTYGDPHTDRVAVGLLASHTLGVGADTTAGAAALVISLGTTNAFVASISRLGYALADDGWAPRALARLSSRAVPAAAIVTVAAVGASGLGLAWVFGWGTQDLVPIPSTLVITTYLLGMGAGVRLLTGRARAAAVLALVLTALTVPFALGHVLIPVVVAAAALAYRRGRAVSSRRNGTSPGGGPPSSRAYR